MVKIKKIAASGQAAFRVVVFGEPASKSNSRRLVFRGKHPRVIKSAKALNYLSQIRKQVKPLPKLMEGDLEMRVKIFYASRRPDLDESLIMDGLQGLVYKNDRQIKKKVVGWGLDRIAPRAEIEILPLRAPHFSE